MVGESYTQTIPWFRVGRVLSDWAGRTHYMPYSLRFTDFRIVNDTFEIGSWKEEVDYGFKLPFVLTAENK